MTSRRHRIDPDARSDRENRVSKPIERLRHRRWVDSVPPSVGRKRPACFVVGPQYICSILCRPSASHSGLFRPIVRPLSFQKEPSSLMAFSFLGLDEPLELQPMTGPQRLVGFDPAFVNVLNGDRIQMVPAAATFAPHENQVSRFQYA